MGSAEGEGTFTTVPCAGVAMADPWPDFGKIPGMGASGDQDVPSEPGSDPGRQTPNFPAQVKPSIPDLPSLSGCGSARRVVNNKHGMLIPIPGLKQGSSVLDITPCLSPVASLAVFETRLMGLAAADGLSLLYLCLTDKGLLCWPGVVSSVIHWGCLEMGAGAVRGRKCSVLEMVKLNFALKWQEVCWEKCICLCPGSAFGSLQVVAGAGKLGPSAQAGHEAMGRGRKPCTQIRGLAPLPAVGDGCRDGDALFLPSYALLVSKMVALVLKPGCGDKGAGQQHLSPSPAVVQLLVPSSPSHARCQAEVVGKLVPKRSLVGKESVAR